MKSLKITFRNLLLLGAVAGATACTKLDEKLNGTLTRAEVTATLGSSGTALLLNAAYADLGGPLTSQDLLFSLEENTSDEALVPTRGGDWDDNGVWRVLHAHTWNADHAYILNVFNALNKASYDATNVLSFNPTAAQAAEAKFIRALVLYYQLDLYGQYPIREPGEDVRNPPLVRTGADAVNFIISELTAALPNLPANNGPGRANPDACRTLLMKCYLQRGAFINRATPTFDAADMNQVITLGTAIMGSGKYTYASNYFDNFNPSNTTSAASPREAIFTYVNDGGVAANNSGPAARWNMTLHYNSYTPSNPNAGWNGFTTISDFYSAFNTTGSGTVAFGPADTLLDPRIGGRYYAGTTNISGMRPGFLVGQQFNEAGVALKDRKGNALSYTPTIASDMRETGTNLEVTGIRVLKYPPDYANYGNPAGNDIMIFRYSDVVLMVAEARARTNDLATARTMVNALRTARGATALTNMQLVNTANVEDPNTLLAERGRELYWESVRRTDLIRFGMFLKPWQYKTSVDARNLVFPVPNQALSVNPNLKQNTGY